MATRPQVTHDGFLIPNAADVTNPRMAEPDRIDFNTLAHMRWGVIEGCAVSATGTLVNVAAGSAVVNGAMVNVPGNTVTLSSGGTADRYDLIYIDMGGMADVKKGAPSADPVFPDPPKEFTTLAAVFVEAGSSDFSGAVLDKRTFLPQSLFAKLELHEALIRNVNGTMDFFRVNGAGRLTWKEDTSFEWIASGKNKLTGSLDVTGALDVTSTIRGRQTITADQNVTGKNLVVYTPANGDVPDVNSHDPGSLWQQPVSGRIYVLTKDRVWQEIATLASASPVGTVTTSLEPPSIMRPLGWIPLDGTTVISEDEIPSLFSVEALAPYRSGTAPHRVMTMPDATDRLLMPSKTGAGMTGGHKTVTLVPDNMPRHKHNARQEEEFSFGQFLPASTGPAGSHGHVVDGGAHDHVVVDPEHKHFGMEYVYGNHLRVICETWGGRYRLDGPFNDRNHPVAVDIMEWVMPAKTGVTISSVGTNGQTGHAHNVSQDGSHTHPVTVAAPGPHKHIVIDDPVGNNVAFDITPQYLTVFAYVRS